MVRSTTNVRVVSLEDHYVDPEVVALAKGPIRNARIGARLEEIGPNRIAEMDAAGIDVSVISHARPSLDSLPADVAVPLARRVNERLHHAVRRYPGRLSAFASLPVAEPTAAAAELERCVTQYGFKGAMTHGMHQGHFLDERSYWPIFERAQALDVPIYMHPSTPHRDVLDLYYRDYVDAFPGLSIGALGYTVEGMVQGVRMVLSGIFDAFPKLKIILGHMGEGIPLLLWRIDHTIGGPKGFSFRDTFCRHFWITTSGFFSDAALQHATAEMGIDRILFSVDWPYIDPSAGTRWLGEAALSDAHRRMVLGENACSLLRL